MRFLCLFSVCYFLQYAPNSIGLNSLYVNECNLLHVTPILYFPQQISMSVLPSTVDVNSCVTILWGHTTALARRDSNFKLMSVPAGVSNTLMIVGTIY